MSKTFASIIALALFSLTALPVFAQGSGQFIPLLPDLPIVNDGSNLPTFINGIFRLTVGLAAILAVIMIVIGGFRYMMTESPFTMGDAKGQIADALIGLLIVLASILILRTINPELVQLDVFRSAQQGAPRAQNPAQASNGGGLPITTPAGPNNTCPPSFTFQNGVCTRTTNQQTGGVPQVPGTPPNPNIDSSGDVITGEGDVPQPPLAPPGGPGGGQTTSEEEGEDTTGPQVPAVPMDPPVAP
jgi:hypothetical protein